MSKRAQRIKDAVGIETILSRYGYNVSEVNREQQFRCDLHGDGNDNAPSARVYPDSNTWYCFACGKTRDAISTVMEKEGFNFGKACSALEKMLGLESWEYEKKDHFEDETSFRNVDLDDKRDVIKRRLEIITKERRLDLNDALRFWEAVDFLCLAKENQSHDKWDKIAERIERKIEDG